MRTVADTGRSNIDPGTEGREENQTQDHAKGQTRRLFGSWGRRSRVYAWPKEENVGGVEIAVFRIAFSAGDQ